METITEAEAVNFLRKRNALLPPQKSPWRTLDEDEQAKKMDWDRLWSRDLEFPISSEEEMEIQAAIALGPPPDDSAKSSDQGNGAHWDKCAWYQPIHFFGDQWGIFIKESCVRRTALMIARFMPPAELLAELEQRDMLTYALIVPVATAQDLYRAAVLVYYLHEHYHHKIECLGFRLHVVLGHSCYLPYKSAVYRPTFGTDDNLEEALANADAYLRLGQSPYTHRLPSYIRHATRAYLKWEFRNCSPPGYRMATHYLTQAAFNAGENVLQAQVKEGITAPVQPDKEWYLCPGMTKSFFTVKWNIWMVVPRGGVPRLPTFDVDYPVAFHGDPEFE